MLSARSLVATAQLSARMRRRVRTQQQKGDHEQSNSSTASVDAQHVVTALLLVGTSACLKLSSTVHPLARLPSPNLRFGIS